MNFKMCLVVFNEISVADDSVWGEVLKMTDAIPVEYKTLEEMFSQKSPATPSDLKPNQNRTSLVRRHSGLPEVSEDTNRPFS